MRPFVSLCGGRAAQGEGETPGTDLNECKQGWHCSAASSPAARLRRSPLRSEATAATSSCWMVQRALLLALVYQQGKPSREWGHWRLLPGRKLKEKESPLGYAKEISHICACISHTENHRKLHSIHRCSYIHGSQNFKTTQSPNTEVLWEIAVICPNTAVPTL